MALLEFPAPAAPGVGAGGCTRGGSRVPADGGVSEWCEVGSCVPVEARGGAACGAGWLCKQMGGALARASVGWELCVLLGKACAWASVSVGWAAAMV